LKEVIQAELMLTGEALAGGGATGVAGAEGAEGVAGVVVWEAPL
jgi:hypothetical protein